MERPILRWIIRISAIVGGMLLLARLIERSELEGTGRSWGAPLGSSDTWAPVPSNPDRAA